LELAAINPIGIREYIEALEVILENGGNEQKKHLFRTLMVKVLVHDKNKCESWFRLLDGSSMKHALENVPDEDDNPLSVIHLLPTVYNQDIAAPRVQPSA